MAAIDEGYKIRTTYDMSWCETNANIQPNTPETTILPVVTESVQALHWRKTTQAPWDPPAASGADGVCWELPEMQPGWKYQAQCEGEWQVFKIGTYGKASRSLLE
jgi:hypothetical protein